MSRIHKYRAWNKKLKRMLEVDSICFSLNTIICKYPEYDNYIWESLDKFILMEYIGRNDEWLTPIYEGDIIEFDDGYEVSDDNGSYYYEFKNKGVIEYDNNLARFTATNINIIDEETLWYGAKVLGNIYENICLLEEK